ncbi:MAG: dihydropteroate synthase [Anaerolineaceae bacterium]|nr:dihydropteroate synthase [Anaerolineaceae bacterium]
MSKEKRSLPEFDKQTLIMGILNLTPDSFSGDGLMGNADPLEAALIQARQFIQGGAHILDIGGESTRPGAQVVEPEEELTRILPIIQALNKEFPETLLSVDTYKAKVAEAALNAGADWINDVWGLRADPELVQVVSRHKAPVILMHNRMTPNSVAVKDRLGGHYVGVQYTDLIADVKTELLESVNIAIMGGVSKSNIILDPGIGFGKTVEQNLKLLNHLNEIGALGFPVLLGVSRKSFIGLTLDLPPDERLEGSLAANAIGILRGAAILRVHDVQQTVRLAKMVDAILHTN